ncbi:MAG: 2-amino-4-hydroxy-6-hydroxymethyldihydropteridine diphosphokinase [Planctomycetota bacterium]
MTESTRPPAMADVYVAVGANIDPESNILAAFDKLAERVRIVATSSFYRTPALGRPEQPPFLNGVWQVETDIGPRPLRSRVLRAVECELGRVRTEDRYAARPIDLDIAVYGDVVIDEPGLRIPDPGIRERAFLAVPLLELAPGLVLPDTGETLADLVVVRNKDLERVPKLTAMLKERLNR